ncbi:unnamed protein product [Lepeophtheirus salmonis]|uniref:(salmon louse) hypothetical protein n=1 Tax=Lepeophtheirus salmonis TaxID=72036 RepID=A0A7R8D4J7_LEPSM|nr:unnamed protein product [Lepeophtheirus salmonis]CAF3026629.1 unnamed protein product [Lepeophtheirus salmonis]
MEDSGDKRKFLSRGLTPNIITNKMSEMHNKVLEFVIGFESAQKSNDLLLSHWEDAVEDFDSYRAIDMEQATAKSARTTATATPKLTFNLNRAMRKFLIRPPRYGAGGTEALVLLVISI